MSKRKTASKKPAKRGRGRPVVFTHKLCQTLGKHMRKLGLTYGAAAFTEETGMGVSLPTAIKIARRLGVSFVRGRPKIKAEKKAA